MLPSTESELHEAHSRPSQPSVRSRSPQHLPPTAPSEERSPRRPLEALRTRYTARRATRRYEAVAPSRRYARVAAGVALGTQSEVLGAATGCGPKLDWFARRSSFKEQRTQLGTTAWNVPPQRDYCLRLTAATPHTASSRASTRNAHSDNVGIGAAAAGGGGGGGPPMDGIVRRKLS